MLTYLYSSLFDSPAQTLVNTVNTVGVMGKGVAKSFKERYPPMFLEYRKLCEEGRFEIGNLQLWKGDSRWVLNFPTKTTWRLPSAISYIERGLETFLKTYERMGIVSISFPPLGCGNGGLDWAEVRPMMESYLSRISIPVYVHNIHFGAEFVPEHKDIQILPATLDQFWGDLRSAIYENKNNFITAEGNQPFSVKIDPDSIVVVRGGRQHEKIPVEEIENAWVVLREGLLSIDRFSDERSRRYKSYLFPLLKGLPYVRSSKISKPGQDGLVSAEALFFARAETKSKDAQDGGYEQRCLSL